MSITVRSFLKSVVLLGTALSFTLAPMRAVQAAAPTAEPSSPEMFEAYWRWQLTGQDPDTALNGDVYFLKLPVSTPNKPGVVKPITLQSGTKVYLPIIAYIGSGYTNGTPDDLPIPDSEFLNTYSATVTFDGNTIVTPFQRYYVSPVYFNPRIEHSTPAYGAKISIFAQGIAFLSSPLASGTHTITNKVFKNGSVMFDNQWTLVVP